MPIVAHPANFGRLSVVIPARDEAGCIASTVEHLHVELRLHGIEHEIVVDDGSTDGTWEILGVLTARIPEPAPVRNPAPHGFGRAIRRGLRPHVRQVARSGRGPASRVPPVPSVPAAGHVHLAGSPRRRYKCRGRTS